MTSHDLLTSAVILASLLALVLVGTFAYLRLLKTGFFRKRRKVREEGQLGEDRAYTALVTSEGISRELADKGFQSPQAAALIEDARRAYLDGNADEAETLSSEARTILLEALQKDHEDASADVEEELPESKPLLGKEYPTHYMEAKFLIGVIEGRVKRTKKTSKKGSKARELYDEARAAFEREDYTEALGLSLQCRRILDGKDPAKRSSRSRCPMCGADRSPKDEFCGECGASLIAPSGCQECGAPLEEGDNFCRKCGAASKVAPPAQ